MLAVSVTFEGFDYQYFYGYVKIEGTAAGDTVSVSESRNRDPQVIVTANGITTRFANPSDGNFGSKIRKVVFHGHAGNDHFTNNSSLPSEAHGNAGTDYLYGGPKTDLFFGGDDPDYLYGKGGNDQLYGQGDLDYLFGDSGDDKLDGGDDGRADQLHGGYGRDEFQMEGYGRFGSFLPYFNLDHPSDFNPTEDSLYGEDELVATDLDDSTVVDDHILDGITADYALAATLRTAASHDYALAVDRFFTSEDLVVSR
jgi:Ca2+-binding RTX toxin-like protein